ncbi:hypothetical protein MFLAVUS_010497 [Mucor flavus]|uniref:Uncharacterized protein n=1 Tax=Mucor flavus TaxID=439312 RepID=A0ABP9ZCY1_9FUNG
MNEYILRTKQSYYFLGVRDIVCAVDCDQDQLTDKQTFKLHSRKLSNASYQERSGMKWNNRIELKNHTNHKCFYGDASLLGSYKGHGLIPVKIIQRAISQKAIVLLVDEFRTSITRCHCHSRMENVYYPDLTAIRQPMLQCNHRIKTLSVRTMEGQKDVPIQNAAQKTMVLFSTVLASVLKDRQYWNRDINAACNIRNTVTRYITASYNLDSRPEQLSRRRRDVEPNEEL